MYYSLFVSITAFLILSVWLDTTSALPKGAEVTVEPEDAPAPSPQPAKGSFFATIHIGSSEVGPNVMYSVRRTGVHDTGMVHEMLIPRHRLRHRKWHTGTTAFVGVTNEKRHDGWTTQAMLNWQFAYWQKRSQFVCAGDEDSGEQATTAPQPTDEEGIKRAMTAAMAQRCRVNVNTVFTHLY